ncbi:VRR-NUC domain-containing protein [Orbus wheelerorum]|uniref:VRR-NUC domain-containing protein n=1 Tax=Orbus wheelerorum TaxID=3074111 RepID=UPI00370D24F0
MNKGSGKFTTAKPSSAGSKSISTSYDASGTMLPVVHPVDIVYLCHKMEAAKNNPYIAKNMTPRYQRQVTKWIRQDAVNFGYQFPYCGEVGYNMTTIPPTALTSQNESHRPSNFPLSQYRMIYREYRESNLYGDPTGSYLLDFRGVDVANPMVSKTELENTLSLQRSGDNDIVDAYRTINPEVASKLFSNGRGMIRIPDVIKKKDHQLLGKEGYNPSNIDTVIELKFPGDSLSEEQRRDYFKIASNNRDKFRLMTLDQCQYRRRGGKEEEAMLANAKADPLYQTVGAAALANPAQVRLIEQQMQQEYDAISRHVIKWVKQQEAEYSRPQMFAQDNTNQQALQQAWQRYEQWHEMVLNAPLAAVGIGIIAGMAAAPIAASSTETATVATVSRSGAQIIKFTPITKATIAASTAAALPLAAQEQSNAYVLESNNQLAYYNQFTEQERLKYQDDRLIEIDYRYRQRTEQIKPIITLDDDSARVRQYRDQYRIDERGKKVHLYPYRQQFYYYFSPGDEPTTDKTTMTSDGVLPKTAG